MNMSTMAVGAYQTACEASPHKQDIDQWFNEDKSCEWISKELKNRYNESISAVSVRKYKKYRDDWVQKEIEKDPLYQAKTSEIREQFNDGIGQLKKIDTIGRLADIIDDTSSYLAEARQDDTVKIRNMKDYALVAGSMLDAIKLYGDTILKAQRFNQINEDPSLLKPTTINVNVKSTLVDILGDVMKEGGYGIIDQLRAGINKNDVQDEQEDTPIESNGTIQEQEGLGDNIG